MTDGFALKSWVIDLINKAFKKNGLRYNGMPIQLDISYDLSCFDQVVPNMTSRSDNYGSVSASSIYSTSYDSYMAFGDITGSHGWYPIHTPAKGDWIEYISNSEIEFDTIAFRHIGGDGYSMAVEISISQDGKQYTSIGSIGPASMEAITIKTFSKLYKAKYIKFTLQNQYPSENGTGFKFSIRKAKPISAYKITATPVVN